MTRGEALQLDGIRERNGVTLEVEFTGVIQEAECTAVTLGAECTVRVLGTEDGRTVLHPETEAERRYPTEVRDIGLHKGHVPVSGMVEGSSHLGGEVRGGPSWRGDHLTETGQGRETAEQIALQGVRGDKLLGL